VGVAFMTVWALGALGLGCLFAFRPDIPADRYIRWTQVSRTTDRLRRKYAPRRQILVWYRIGGIFFVVMGVLFPVLALTGVLRVEG
jgi:hypothetical protein